MTPDQVLAAVSKYESLIDLYPPERVDPGDTWMPDNKRLSHIRWMCAEIPNLLRAGRHEKAARWLGFVQGVLWSHGYLSITDLKDDNRA